MAYTHSGAPNQAEPARPATELENLIAELRGSLTSIGNSVHDIHRRVMPPTPEAAGTKPSPVAITYSDHLRELGFMAETIRNVVGELNGRI